MAARYTVLPPIEGLGGRRRRLVPCAVLRDGEGWLALSALVGAAGEGTSPEEALARLRDAASAEPPGPCERLAAESPGLVLFALLELPARPRRPGPAPC